MTLTQLASFITTKLGQTDTASVAVCKNFINQRYQMIWDSFIWTDTLGVASHSVSALDESITLSDVPSITFYQSAVAPTTFIDFVVATRFTTTGQTDGVEVIASDFVTFFQIDPNSWNNDTNRNTTPKNFIKLPKDGNGYCRIKPVPTPDQAGTLYVLGKLKFVALGDSDSPCLRGIDNTLLAFAEGDMLERSRQYGKAQSKFSEAATQAQIMKDIEVSQAQTVSRIIPENNGDYTIIDIL